MLSIATKPRKVNNDGTRNVYCPRCRNHVGTVSATTMIGTALCVVCQAGDRGEVLPDDVVAQLRSKTLDVTPSQIYYDPMMGRDMLPEDPETFQIAQTEGYFSRVVRTVRAKAIAAIDAIKVTKPAPVSSVKIAQAKRRKRLFDGPIDD